MHSGNRLGRKGRFPLDMLKNIFDKNRDIGGSTINTQAAAG
jgi:hypothetical protein